MKVLIDTNIILDVLCDRAPFARDALKIFRLCEVNKITGYISALSVPNIIYIMRKELDPEKIGDILEKLSLIFTIADLKGTDLKKAVKLGFGDYEDAVQSVCAQRIKADFIVTRNVKDFSESKVPAIEPPGLISRL